MRESHRIYSTPVSYSEDHGAHLSPETDYPEWRLPWFLSVPPRKCRTSVSIENTTVSFQLFPIQFPFKQSLLGLLNPLGAMLRKNHFIYVGVDDNKSKPDPGGN